jgi:hypothetical protein
MELLACYMPGEAMLSGHCAFEIGKVRLWSGLYLMGNQVNNLAIIIIIIIIIISLMAIENLQNHLIFYFLISIFWGQIFCQ